MTPKKDQTGRKVTHHFFLETELLVTFINFDLCLTSRKQRIHHRFQVLLSAQRRLDRLIGATGQLPNLQQFTQLLLGHADAYCKGQKFSVFLWFLGFFDPFSLGEIWGIHVSVAIHFLTNSIQYPTCNKMYMCSKQGKCQGDISRILPP